MATADVLDERVPGADHSSAAELFEAAHGSQAGLQPSVIGFDRVLRISLGDVTGSGYQLIEHPRVGGARSVVTSVGDGPCSSARVKNRRVATMSRFSETNTSMTCPNWSIALYK